MTIYKERLLTKIQTINQTKIILFWL